MPNQAILLLGSNQGNKIAQINKALNLLEKLLDIAKQSHNYQTDAWGNTNQDYFINKAILVNTKLNVQDLLTYVLQTELQMGRTREIKWQARIIDIDIIFFNQQIINQPNLIVPHPHMQVRRFVLEPINEIVPNWVHPILKKTVQNLLQICPDNLSVKKI